MDSRQLQEMLARSYNGAHTSRPIEVGDICIEKLDGYLEGYAVYTAANRNERNDYPNVRVLIRKPLK